MKVTWFHGENTLALARRSPYRIDVPQRSSWSEDSLGNQSASSPREDLQKSVLSAESNRSSRGDACFLPRSPAYRLVHFRFVARKVSRALPFGDLGRVPSGRPGRTLGNYKSNPVLEKMAAPHLWRPAGRPPKGGYEDVVELGWYQAETWKHPQRVILVIIDRPDPKTGQLPLFVKHFFLVTNWTEEQKSGENVLEHYRRRGTFEDRLGEFKAAVGPHLSSPQFHENEVLLLLSLLAYNLAGMLRTELEAEEGACWDLKRLQLTVLKAGGRLTKHARRMVLTLARAVTPFWQTLAACLARWRLPNRYAPRGPQHRDWMPPPPHAHQQLVLRS